MKPYEDDAKELLENAMDYYDSIIAGIPAVNVKKESFEKGKVKVLMAIAAALIEIRDELRRFNDDKKDL